MVLPGELDRLREEFDGGGCAGRVVRVIQVKQFGAFALVLREGLEVGQESVFLKERELHDFAAEVFGPGAEHAVAGDGQDGDVAGIDEAGREEREGGFAADGVNDLRVGIELDAVQRLHVAGGGGLEIGAAVVGVGAVFPLRGFFREAGDHGRERHVVGLADAHVDQLDAGIFGGGGAFGAFDLFELVDLGVFAEVGTADPGGEVLLEEVFLRHRERSPFWFQK